MIENLFILQIVAMGALILSLTCTAAVNDPVISDLLPAAGSATRGGIFSLHALPRAGACLLTPPPVTAVSLRRSEEDEKDSGTVYS